MKIKNLIVLSFLIISLTFSLGAYAKASKKKISGHLNINTATVEQLDELPGISPKKAQAITDYRKDHPFRSLEELDQVKGFSPKSIEKLKPYVATEGSNNLVVEGGKSKKQKKEKTNKKEKTKSS